MFIHNCIYYLIFNILVKLDDDDNLNNILNTHDLVPNKYEGGLKVWELSLDLAKFIYNVGSIDNLKSFASNDKSSLDQLESIKSFLNYYTTTNTGSNEKESKNDLIELRILELGCGHALPTLSLIKYIQDNLKLNKGSELNVICYLQDFNEQIIEQITFENLKKFEKDRSAISIKVKKQFKFVYGDWKVIFEKVKTLNTGNSRL